MKIRRVHSFRKLGVERGIRLINIEFTRCWFYKSSS